MKKMTITITGMSKEIQEYVVEKISPTPNGLSLELGDRVPYLAPTRKMAEMIKKELIILTPFHEDGTPVLALAPCWYKALIPRPRQLPKEYRFRSSFSLRKEIEGIKEKFGLDLRDRAIIFCVKRKNTENNWRGSIQRIARE